MAPREDLINSAVDFLHDPSVAAAPMEKRRAFLESKNLTAEEIDISFARVGSQPPASSAPPPPAASYQQYSQPQPYGYGYPPYGSNPWAQQAMEPPRRDWRDWFIMATVTSGIGYGLYQIGKRYVMPLIKPPTPEQLEQDKGEIAGQFERAFGLIEQLATDTAALKDAESARAEKLDKALEDVEGVLGELKAAGERREAEGRRLADDVNGLRALVPKALDGWKSDRDAKVAELSAELRSLKTLLANRLQQPPQQQSQSAPSPIPSPAPVLQPAPQQQQQPIVHSNGGVMHGVPGVSLAPGSSPAAADSAAESASGSASAAAGGQSVPQTKRPNRAAIPAWQMAAAQQASGGDAGSAQS